MTRGRDWSPVDWHTDPTPGDPDRVADLATRYRRTAEAVRTAAGGLSRISDGQAYVGRGGDELRERTRDLAEQVRALETRYSEAAEALDAYHPQQHAAQVEADAALRRARDAEALQRSAQRSLSTLDDSPPPLPGEPEDPAVTAARSSADRDLAHASSELARAKEAVQRAHDAQHAAGNTAADRLREAIAGDGLDDSWKDDLLGVVKSIADVASFLAAVAGLLSLLLCFVPVIGQIVAAIALLATVVSLVCNAVLLLNDKPRWEQLKSDLMGLALFGVGRLLANSARITSMATRGRAWQQARTFVAGNHATRRQEAFRLIGGRMRAPERAHADVGYLANLQTGARHALAEQRTIMTGAFSALRSPRATMATAESQLRTTFSAGGWRSVADGLDISPEVRALTGMHRSVANPDVMGGTALSTGLTVGTVSTTLTSAINDGGTVVGAFTPEVR